MRSWFARLWAASIWHPDAPAMQRVQKRFRPVFRIGLPVIDAVLVAFSVFGVVVGSNAVREFTAAWFNPLLAGGIGVSALVAFIGLVFNRPALEVTSKFVLGACLVLYFIFLVASATVRTATALLTAALVVIVLVILALRIFDLIDQAAIQEADE